METFEQLKHKLLFHLKNQLKPEELSKSLAVNEILTKASYPVGTIRTWKGKKYIKTAPGKWQRKYESAGRGANQAIKNLMKKIEDAGTPEELYQLIMQNQSRFRDENGRMLPEVQQLHDLVQKRQEKVEGDSKTVIAVGSYAPEFSYFRKQVGTVISSINSIPQTEKKTSGIDGIRAKYNASKSVDGDEDEIYVREAGPGCGGAGKEDGRNPEGVRILHVQHERQSEAVRQWGG